MIPDPIVAYGRFKEQLRKPLAVQSGDFIVFSNGSDSGYRYPVARLATAPHPLSELFEYPWFTEQHATAAVPFVRAFLDQARTDTLHQRDAQRDRNDAA